MCPIPQTHSFKKDLSIALMQPASSLLILSPGLYLLHTKLVKMPTFFSRVDARMSYKCLQREQEFFFS